MDIFGEGKQGQDDEFEFKPLTQGLGFHKKTIDLSSEVKKSNIASQSFNNTKSPNSKSQTQAESVRRLVDSFPTFDQPFMTQPLPRKTEFTKDSNTEASYKETPSNEALHKQVPFAETPRREESMLAFKSPKMGGARFEESKAEAKASIISPAAGQFDFAQVAKAPKISNKISVEPLAPAIKEVPFSIAAFIFDSFVVMGLTFLFTGVVLAVTQADLLTVLANAQTDIPTRASLVVLFLSVIQLYIVLSRSFFGRTIGDWAFDVQLGNQQQQKSAIYPILVGWRALLVMLTGFITLPILSIISRRDVAAFLTGVRTYRSQ